MNQVETLGNRTLGKVKMRILPYLFLLYIIAYLDRVNIGYAALDMNKALGISSAAFGLLTSIFFVGYFIFEVPSNIMLHRVGARKWIARILVSWGIVSLATMFVQSINHIYIIRFLLGLAEAGFFPGLIYYMTYWFPEKERARTIALFMIAIPAANIIGSPLSTWIMANVHWLNIPGWRWLFLVEAVPAIICGFITYFYLTDRPEQAKWLSLEEKNWLIAELQKEEHANQAKAQAKHLTIFQTFLIPRVWRLALIYLTYVIGGIAITLWMPQIVKGFASLWSNTMIGQIVAIPYIIAAIVMFVWSRHSDRTGERRVHTALPPLVAALGLVITIMSADIVVKFIGITIALVGTYASYAPFWALPSIFLSEESAAVGIATINAFAQLGGFSGSLIVGYLNGAFGMNSVFIFLSTTLIICFLLTITMRNKDITLNYAKQSERKGI